MLWVALALEGGPDAFEARVVQVPFSEDVTQTRVVTQIFQNKWNCWNVCVCVCGVRCEVCGVWCVVSGVWCDLM